MDWFKPLVSTLLIAAFALPAQAASPIGEILCAPRDEMKTKLSQQFGAHQAGIGTRGPEAVMEVWTHDRSGDWTLVLTYTNGNSCIVAMGENWEQMTPAKDPA